MRQSRYRLFVGLCAGLLLAPLSAPAEDLATLARRGSAFYGTVCANCHGKDGKKIDEMPPMGKVANANPWETLHKIMNGQPDEKMLALRAFPIDISVDILAYAQTLPR